MSTKTGSGKLLKGGASGGNGTSGEIDIKAILAALQTSGASLANVTIENATIYGGLVDDVVIGSTSPNNGVFASVMVGTPDVGGPAVFYGGGSGAILAWNPDSSFLNLTIPTNLGDQGGLSVTGGITRLGHFIFKENTMSTDEGGINIVPLNGTLVIESNITQSNGAVIFNSSEFDINSTSTIDQTCIEDATINAEYGTLTLSAGNIQSSSTILECNVITVSATTISVTLSSHHSQVITLRVNEPVILTTSLGIKVYATVSAIINANISVSNVSNITLFVAGDTISIEPDFASADNKIIIDPNDGEVQIPFHSSLCFTDPYANSKIYALQDSNNDAQRQGLSVEAKRLQITDQTPIIASAVIHDSDTGILCRYSSSSSLPSTSKYCFFGRKQDTGNFTYITNANVTIDPITGAKTVTGDTGQVQFETLVISNELRGDPDLNLIATRDVIMQPGNAVRFDTGNIKFDAASTTLDAGVHELSINAGPSIDLVSATTNISSRLAIGDGGAFTSTNTGITLNTSGLFQCFTDTIIPYPYKLYFGNQNYVGLDASGSTLYFAGHCEFEKGIAFTIHDDEHFKIGDDVETYFIAHTGNLTLNIHKDYIIDSQGGHIYISPATSLDVDGTRGFLFVDSSIYLSSPNPSEIGFGSLKSIGTLLNPLAFTIASDITIDLAAPQVETDILHINTRLEIGSPASLFINDTTNALHIHDDFGVVIDGACTINGDLVVYGDSVRINPLITTFHDPIITLGYDAIVSERKDRGVEFLWHNNEQETKWGFIGFSQQSQRFKLIADGVNTNEVYSGNVLGDLECNSIYLTSQFETPSIKVGTISNLVPNQPLVIDASTIQLFNPNSIITSTGTITFNSSTGIDLQSDIINVGNSGNVVVTYTGNDNTLHFTGTDLAYIDLTEPIVKVSSLLFSNDVSMTANANNAVTMTGDFNLLGSINIPNQSSLIIGTTQLTEAVIPPAATNTVEWKSSTNGGTDPMTLSIHGYIKTAIWQGEPIDAAYGGTGHLGPWVTGQVIFCENEASLGGRNSFTYDPIINALTVSGGQVLCKSVHVDDNWIFEQTDEMLIIRAVSALTSTLPALALNNSVIGSGRYQIGLGCDLATLTKADDDSVFVDGNIVFSQQSRQGIKWSVTNYINNDNNNQDICVNCLNNTVFNCNVCIPQSRKAVFPIASMASIYGRDLQDLVLYASNKVIVDKCLRVIESIETPTVFAPSNQALTLIGGDGGDIILQSTNVVSCSTSPLQILQIGSLQQATELINGSQKQFEITTINDAYLLLSSSIGINLSTPTITYGGALSIQSSTSGGTLISDLSATHITIDTPQLNLPSCMRISGSNNIGFNANVASGDIEVIAPSTIKLDAPNVVITGNLTVSKYTTLTIESETTFDSGVIKLGGSELREISSVSAWGTNSQETCIGLTTPHELVIGDVIDVIETVDMDGTYTVVDVPSNTSLIIARPYVPVSEISGHIHYKLTHDPGHDVGVHINWNTGTAYRTGFFGFDRSTMRFKFVPDATIVNGVVYDGNVGDFEMNTLFCSTISSSSASPLVIQSPLSLSSSLSCGNVSITGGEISNVSISNSSGVFNAITILDGGIDVQFTGIVTRLNSDLLDNKHGNEYIQADGSIALTANWNAGSYGITAANLAVSGFTQPNHLLISSAVGNGDILEAANLSFIDSTLHVPKISGFQLQGTLDANNSVISNAVLNNVVLTGTFDASQCTNVIFADGQIDAAALSGVANIDITGNASTATLATTVTNGVYTTMYETPNSVLVKNAAGNMESIKVENNQLIGLVNGMTSVGAVDVASLIIDDSISRNVMVANSILKADVDSVPVSLVVPTNSVVGRVNDTITAISFADLRNYVDVIVTPAKIYDAGALMRDGCTAERPEGGQMSSILYTSSERVQIYNGSLVDLNTDTAETSYISVTATSSSSSVKGTVVLPNGLRDGHRKTILLSGLSEGECVLIVKCESLLIPEEPLAIGWLMWVRGQTLVLQWDNVLMKWLFVGGTGAETITEARNNESYLSAKLQRYFSNRDL